MSQRRTIALVDGNSYIHRAYHAIRELRTSRGIPTNAVLGFLNMLLKVLREEKPDMAVVVFDAGGETFRHRRYPEYKANRPGMPEDLAVQVDYIHRLTRAFGLKVVEQRGLEADDLLASLGRRAREHGLDVLYITGDKDIHQLIDRHSIALDTMKGKRLDLPTFRAERGIEPPQMVDLMALTGDPGDNVPGVPGIGPKIAEKLVREYGTLAEIYRRLDEMPEGKTKEALRTHRGQAELSRELVVLKDDLDVTVDWDHLAARMPDTKTLRSLLEELEFKKYLRELDLGGEETPLEVSEVRGDKGTAEWLRTLDHERPTSFVLAGQPGRTQVALTQDGSTAAVLPVAGPGGKGVERLLASRHAPKWGYDVKASLRRLVREGLRIEGVEHDVLLAAYLLNPSDKGNTLADLAGTWLGISSLNREEAAAVGQARLFTGEEEERAVAVRQVAVVHRLGNLLGSEVDRAGMGELYRQVELPLAGVLADMEATGINVDLDALAGMSKEMEVILARTEEEIYTLAGTTFNIGSPKQLAEVLFDRLGLPVQKRTKTGASTDEEVLTALAAVHELPSRLLAHRSLAKLKNTYVDALPRLVSPEDGRIHTTFNQAATATGRLSSSNPNLQNIPVRTEWGMRIRRAFIPRKGWRFISADYSQIELRILAHLSGDETLIESFRKGEDIHERTAMEIFRVPAGGVTKEMRRAAKVINFGIIYGMSPFGLSKELGVDQREAKKYIDDYFTVYRGVRGYLDGLVAGAKRDGWVSTLFGRRRSLPELSSSKPQVVQFAERAALNTPIQGTAADLIKKAMIELHRRLEGEDVQSRLLVQIHDELLLEAPPSEVKKVAALVSRCMEGAAAFSVPIVVDVAVGDTWGDLH